MRNLILCAFFFIAISLNLNGQNIEHYLGVVEFQENKPVIEKLVPKYDSANFIHESGNLSICMNLDVLEKCYKTIDPKSLMDERYLDATTTSNTTFVIIPVELRESLITFNGPSTNFKDRKIDLKSISIHSVASIE